jgi:hypothetical protein
MVVPGDGAVGDRIGLAGQEAREAVPARAEPQVRLLQAVARGRDGHEGAVAGDDVLGEVASGSQDDQRAVVGGGGEERADRGKELHGVDLVSGCCAGPDSSASVWLSAGVLARLQILFGGC